MTIDVITRTDVQVLKNLLARADEWQKELSGPKWIMQCASERELLRDADRIIDRLAQQTQTPAP
jgi:hypothetical protein